MSLEYAKYLVFGVFVISLIINRRASAKQINRVGGNVEGDSNSDFEGKVLTGSSANISGSEYNGALKFIVNEEELMIRSNAISMSKISARLKLSKLHGRRKRSLFFTYVYLTYDDDPSLEIENRVREQYSLILETIALCPGFCTALTLSFVVELEQFLYRYL